LQLASPQPLSKRRGEWYAFKTNVVRCKLTLIALIPYATHRLQLASPRLLLALPPAPLQGERGEICLVMA
ncbi:hypothetical protein, partial [Prevotella conceptionensis]|uniref:hypothetical protein n=1 Tax=Prevotella conceptionensis TaxID=340486 RepID=UPI001E46B8B8